MNIMNRRKIIIVAIIVFLLGTGGYLLLRRGDTGTKGGGIFSSIFPTSPDVPVNPPATGGAGGGGDSGGEDGQTAGSPKRLFQLTQTAISGSVAVSTSTVRYIERQTGRVYEISPEGEGMKRITSTTILKTTDSFFSPKGDEVLIRYEQAEGEAKLQNFLAHIPSATSTPLELTGAFIAKSAGFAAGRADDSLFYLEKSGNYTNGILTNFKNEKRKLIFFSPFGEFNTDFPNKDTVILLTKPSYSAPGFLYSINTKSQKLDKILGGIAGLTGLLSGDGKWVYYSESVNRLIKTKFFDILSKQSQDLGVNTLPEKCVWSRIKNDVIYCAVPSLIPGANYPDDWYQGLVSFDDNIWQISLGTGETSVILSPDFYLGEGTDAVNLSLSPEESYLLYTNKKDGTLWSYKLK